MGCDEGTPVCIAYAAGRPERVARLVLWGAYARGAETYPSEAAHNLAAMARTNWSLARRAIANVALPSGPTVKQRWWSRLWRASLSAEVAAKYLELQASVDVTSLLPRILAPTLVLHRRSGRSIPISEGRGVAALIPNARFVAIEGDAGIPAYGDTSFLDIVDDFLGPPQPHTP